MLERTMLASKIHGVKVTKTSKGYSGSITLPAEMLIQANIKEYEQVQVVDVDNGARFTTYAIVGWLDEVCVNGAAARLVSVGDKLIIMTYMTVRDNDSNDWEPIIVKVS